MKKYVIFFKMRNEDSRIVSRIFTNYEMAKGYVQRLQDELRQKIEYIDIVECDETEKVKLKWQ